MADAQELAVIADLYMNGLLNRKLIFKRLCVRQGLLPRSSLSTYTYIVYTHIICCVFNIHILYIGWGWLVYKYIRERNGWRCFRNWKRWKNERRARRPSTTQTKPIWRIVCEILSCVCLVCKLGSYCERVNCLRVCVCLLTSLNWIHTANGLLFNVRNFISFQDLYFIYSQTCEPVIEMTSIKCEKFQKFSKRIN